jgi:hypothetical protein
VSLRCWRLVNVNINDLAEDHDDETDYN